MLPMNTTGHSPAAFRKLRPNRYGLLIILIGLAPLIFATSVMVDRFPTPYRAKVNAHLSETVQRHALLVDQFMQATLSTIRFLAESTDGDDLADSNFLHKRLEILKRIHGTVFEDMGWVDDNGFQVAYAGPLNLQGAQYTGATWYGSARQQPTFISDVFPGLRGYPHFIVAVRKTWKSRQWILRATIDFKAFTALVENLQMGKTGRAFIVNRRGAFQTRPPEPASAATYLKCNREGRLLAGGAVRMLQVTEGQGPERIIMTVALNGGNWLLVFEQTLSEALYDLQRNLRAAGLALTCGVIAVVTLAFWIGIQVEGPAQKNG